MRTTATSTALLDGLKDPRNLTAWAEYVGRYRPLIVSWCARLRLQPSDAEDVAQEALLSFAASYRDGRYERERGRLRSWLFGIVRNMLQRWRREQPRGQVVPIATEGSGEHGAHIAAEDEFAKVWEEEWRKAVLQQCLAEVRAEVEPATFRAFELFACEGWPAAKVADELGLSTNAVWIAKHRVLRRMRSLHARIDEEF